MEATVVISLSNPCRMIEVRMHLGNLGILWNKVKFKGKWWEFYTVSKTIVFVYHKLQGHLCFDNLCSEPQIPN